METKKKGKLSFYNDGLIESVSSHSRRTKQKFTIWSIDFTKVKANNDFEGPFCLSRIFIFQNERNQMKKSASQGFRKTGKPGLTWRTGSYVPASIACLKRDLVSLVYYIRPIAETKISALNKNYTYLYNIVCHFAAFQNLDELVYSLKNRHDGLKGALVDTYVAGEVKEFDDKGLRVNKILDYSSYYGIVFGDGKMAENEFQKCLDDYVLVHKAEISKTVEAMTKPMKVLFAYAQI